MTTQSDLLTRAATLETDGRLEEALVLYDRVLALEPDHSPALARKGECLFALERFEGAIDCFLTSTGSDLETLREWGILQAGDDPCLVATVLGSLAQGRAELRLAA